MSKSIALGLVGAGGILLAILLTGCSDAPSPTPSARAVPTPTMAPTQAPTATPTSAPTMAPTNTPTPEPTPATATLPLGVYLTLCPATDIDLADDLIFGDLSSELAAEADRFEALTPPAQLSEWHLLNIEAYRTAQAVADTQPKDDVVDFDSSLLIAAESAFIEKLREAAARVPKDVLQRMIEAGCIGPEEVPDDNEDVPDDHGDSEGAATAIRVGTEVRGAVDYDDDIDFFRFQAERGQSYQIDVALGTLDDSELVLLGPDSRELAYNDDYGDTYASRLYWEDLSSGERYVVVWGADTSSRGTYTLTVSLSDLIDDHGNSEGDATAIRVGTEARGAVDYDDDIDFFRFQAERGQSYQIDVALGTLDDSIVELYDVNWSFLDTNDDYGDTYTSRLYWEAPSSGERYVAVYGYGTGTYTLTVSLVDDHGDDIDDATVAATPLSLDEYLTLCVTTELELADDATFGDLSSELAAEADRFEALTPPAQLSEWHLLNIEGSRTIQAFVELQPKDDVIDFVRFFLMATISADSEEKLRAAAARLPEDVRRQMIEAGCIDPEDVLDDHEDVPDDHGNDIDDATAIRVGADVRGAMDYDGDIDFFRFQAERGQSYQIDVALGTLDDSIVELHDVDWSFLDTNDDYGDTYASRLYWEAPSSGERYVAVEGYGTGTYTLTVSLSDLIDDHGNSEGGVTTIRVGEMAEDMTVATGERLQEVKSRDKVICASRNDVPGYGYLDASGNNVGFDIDLCRALAAAVLGDPNKIEIHLITAAERGPTIQSGEVDMLVRTVTWTTSRDSQWGNYAQTMFYDGQGFLVRKDLGISSALELQGASVCVTQGTTTELNLQDFSNQNGLNIEPLTFEDPDAAVAAYEAGQCDAFTNDRSQLAAISSAFENRADNIILPETISEEPMGPVVPHGDDQWFDIVKTIMGILIYAEAYGVSSSNVPTSVTGDTKVDRLFGLEGSYGQESLGISNTAAQDVIRAVGNYGEIYARNLGPNGINLPRSDGDRNALWSAAPCEDCPKGGQIYSAPLR